MGAETVTSPIYLAVDDLLVSTGSPAPRRLRLTRMGL